MFIIAGLGNPDEKYQGTRHNVGFDVVDRLAEKYQIAVDTKKHRALNLSGESIRSLVEYSKIDPEEELLVIYDDISLEVGQLRIRRKGSAGGHNGIKNIIANLGSSVFPRIKVGVGEKPKGYDLADYVLGKFSKEDRVLMEEGYDLACEASALIMQGAIDQAMNEYNQKKKE